MSKFFKVSLLLVIFSLICASGAAAGVCYDIIDMKTGQTVYQTAWPVRVQDEFLTGDNKRYKIKKVDGNTAEAEFIGSHSFSALKDFYRGDFLEKRAFAAEKPLVGVYHTHNDESYVKTDGEESSDSGNGGILKVGDAFTKALEKNGLTVIHATDSHIPHDNMAYERSRRTAARLVKEQPAAIFDLHRDATPPEAYQGEVNGEAITQVQLVVGKYGPTGKQIEDYALQIKKAADEEYPGLVKGIFFAKGGDYNQDLHAHSMLLEVGSHTNDRHQAQRGIELFANVVPKVLNIKSAEAAPSETLANSAYAQKEETGAYKSAMYILLAFLGGTIIYVYVGSGSMAEARSKAVHFFTREFNDVFGKKKK